MATIEPMQQKSRVIRAISEAIAMVFMPDCMSRP